jgi:hypothetical protein
MDRFLGRVTSLLWRLDEIFSKEGRGAYLKADALLSDNAPLFSNIHNHAIIGAYYNQIAMFGSSLGPRTEMIIFSELSSNIRKLMLTSS